VRFNIDVKGAHAAGPLAELIRRAAAWDRVCIASFSAARLRASRKFLDRPVCMATTPLGAVALFAGLPAATMRKAFASRNVCCAQLPFGMVSAPLIARAHAAGLHVHVWTVNDKNRMHSLLDLGVDGIITDQTQMLRDVLIARGQWHPRSAG
jgi:glycerophosphoryl diester phosphodiesterase